MPSDDLEATVSRLKKKAEGLEKCLATLTRWARWMTRWRKLRRSRYQNTRRRA